MENVLCVYVENLLRGWELGCLGSTLPPPCFGLFPKFNYFLVLKASLTKKHGVLTLGEFLINFQIFWSIVNFSPQFINNRNTFNIRSIVFIIAKRLKGFSDANIVLTVVDILNLFLLIKFIIIIIIIIVIDFWILSRFVTKQNFDVLTWKFAKFCHFGHFHHHFHHHHHDHYHQNYRHHPVGII